MTTNTERKGVDVLAVSWAAPTITNHGGTLHAIPNGWDVEMPDGSWRAANNASELCAIARECRAGGA